jgi:hypothetical protein
MCTSSLFFFIPNVISHQACWVIDKIHVRLAAGHALVAVKCRAVNVSSSLKYSLYITYRMMINSYWALIVCISTILYHSMNELSVFKNKFAGYWLQQLVWLLSRHSYFSEIYQTENRTQIETKICMNHAEILYIKRKN